MPGNTCPYFVHYMFMILDDIVYTVLFIYIYYCIIYDLQYVYICIVLQHILSVGLEFRMISRPVSIAVALRSEPTYTPTCLMCLRLDPTVMDTKVCLKTAKI